MAFKDRRATASVSVILDTQYGSCGKGAFAQYYAATVKEPDVAVRTGGPNAGHSVLLRNVHTGEWESLALRHIPAAAVASEKAILALPPTALISPDVLASEIQALSNCGINLRGRFFIDPLTTVITYADEERESGMRERIGSTREGVGAAQAAKVMREATLAREVPWLEPYIRPIGEIWDLEPEVVHIETTQGIGLGLHFGHYPFATSRDITPMQAVADARLPAGQVRDIMTFALARTYPIRVAGNSGPFYGEELDWETIQERTSGWVTAPERTTVTKLPRRIAEWSSDEVFDGLKLVGPGVNGVLTFADYVYPAVVRRALGTGLDLSEKSFPLGWHADPRVLNRLSKYTDELWAEGAFDPYRRPFQDAGGDLTFISWGFGVLVPTPVIR